MGGAGYTNQQYSGTVGGTGGTSSFGNIASALGGSGGVSTTAVQGLQGSCVGNVAVEDGNNSWHNIFALGPCGWLPGFQLTQQLNSVGFVRGPINGVSSGAPTRGNASGVLEAYAYWCSAGYGAGGATLCYSCGSGNNVYLGFSGNAGEIIVAAHTVTSTAGIAVTVGKGGTGPVHNNSKTICAGAGAPGCVAVFW